MSISYWMCRRARDSGCLELNGLLKVKSRVGEQVNLIVDINVDCGVQVDRLQVRGTIKAADIRTWNEIYKNSVIRESVTHTCVLVDSGGDGYGGNELVLVPVVLAVADLEPWSLLLVGGSVPGHGPVSLAGQRDRLPGLHDHL